MNSLERLYAAVERREPDCMPVAPYMGLHGARVAGANLADYCRSGRVMAEAQWRAYERYGQDALVLQSDQYYIVEGFGCRTSFHDDQIPTLETPAVRELADIESLNIPDPHSDGRMHVTLEAIGILKERIGGEVVIRCSGVGMFSMAAHLMGLENWLYHLGALARDADDQAEAACRRLMDLTTAALVRYSKACVDAGGNIVQAGDSLASMDMISPACYEKWVFPYEREYFREMNAYIAERGATCKTLLHICGGNGAILERMADTGADILELDHKVDLADAKARVGDRVCLIGNIDPVGVLLHGSTADVETRAVEAMDAAGAGGGFILGSGCEVPPDAPTENVAAMIRAARKRRYDDAPT